MSSSDQLDPDVAGRIPGAVVVMIDLATHAIHAANEAAQKLLVSSLPCSVEEWSARAEITHADGSPFVNGKNPFAALDLSGTIESQPVEMLGLDGVRRQYELTAFPLAIDGGRTTATCIFLPADGMGSAESRRITNQAVYATQRSFSIADLRQDDAPLIFVNPAFERISGYSTEESIGRNCRFLQGPGTDKGAVAQLRRSIEERKPVTVRLLNYRKDGSTFWNEVSMAPLFDGDGVATHFVGVQTDVTAQVLAQRDLESVYASERRAHFDARQARGRLEAILEQLPMGVRIIDPSGRLLLINDQVLDIFGLEAGAQQADWDSYVAYKADGTTYESSEWPIQRSVLTGEVVTGEEMHIVRSDGQARILQIRSAPVRDENDEIVAAISLTDDITERKRAEQQLVEARERAANLATTLQQALLPVALPTVEGLEFGSAYTPVTEGLDVGGDFYDVFEQRDGEWVIAIGDVMGKGAAAAAVTSLARHAIRTAALRARRPGTLLNVLNQALLREGDGHPFCTVATGVITRTSTGARVALGLGGHPRPYVVRASGEVEQVGHPGTLMGVVNVVDIGEVEFDLGVGDAVVMYTDGVTEARNEDGFLGEEGLAEILAKLAPQNLTAEEMAQSMQREVTSVLGTDLRDDLAILVTKVTAPAGHVGL